MLRGGATVTAISVVMPVRNGGPFLWAALDSVLGQTFGDFELVVVDERLDRRDARLKVLRNPRSLGIAAALNRGVTASRAPLVARMDADDVSAPDCLARQKTFLDASPHVVLCGGSARLIDARGAVTGLAPVPTGYASIRAALPRANCFVHGSVVFRRHEVEAAGLYSTDAAVRYAEDYELWVRLAARHEVENLPGEPLYDYRVHGGPRGPDYGEVQARSVTAIQELARRLLASEGHGG